MTPDDELVQRARNRAAGPPQGGGPRAPAPGGALPAPAAAPAPQGAAALVPPIVHSAELLEDFLRARTRNVGAWEYWVKATHRGHSDPDRHPTASIR
eukprot:12096250-Alexandrium_andersonii.AAC.1